MPASDHDRVHQQRTDHHSAEEMATAAQGEPMQSSRSCLAPCASVISILREKRWSFAAITAWLDRRGIHVAESTVQRFYRSQQRRGIRGGQPCLVADDRPASSLPAQPHETHTRQAPRGPVRSASRPKYNTDF